MTAQIAGFVTRAQAGLRSPRSVSRNIDPERGGVGVHYGGPRQAAAEPRADHALCTRTWRAWQAYHMDTHGWSDIAYTGGFCNHGFAYAGRGVGIRTAANGTNSGNQYFYAATWIGGEGQTPTAQALDAADWWITTLRSGGAGSLVKPHRWFKSTGCPGDPLVGYAGTRDNRPIPTITVPTQEDDDVARLIQHGPRGTIWATDGTQKWGAPSLTILRELAKTGVYGPPSSSGGPVVHQVSAETLSALPTAS